MKINVNFLKSPVHLRLFVSQRYYYILEYFSNTLLNITFFIKKNYLFLNFILGLELFVPLFIKNRYYWSCANLKVTTYLAHCYIVGLWKNGWIHELVIISVIDLCNPEILMFSSSISEFLSRLPSYQNIE